MFRPFIRPSSGRRHKYISEKYATEEFDCEGEAPSISHYSFFYVYGLSDDGREYDRKMS